MTHPSDFLACSNGTKSLFYTGNIHEKTIYVLDVMEKLAHIMLTDGEVSLIFKHKLRCKGVYF